MMLSPTPMVPFRPLSLRSSNLERPIDVEVVQPSAPPKTPSGPPSDADEEEEPATLRMRKPMAEERSARVSELFDRTLRACRAAG